MFINIFIGVKNLCRIWKFKNDEIRGLGKGKDSVEKHVAKALKGWTIFGQFGTRLSRSEKKALVCSGWDFQPKEHLWKQKSALARLKVDPKFRLGLTLIRRLCTTPNLFRASQTTQTTQHPRLATLIPLTESSDRSFPLYPISDMLHWEKQYL